VANRARSASAASPASVGMYQLEPPAGVLPVAGARGAGATPGAIGVAVVGPVAGPKSWCGAGAGCVAGPGGAIGDAGVPGGEVGAAGTDGPPVFGAGGVGAGLKGGGIVGDADGTPWPSTPGLLGLATPGVAVGLGVALGVSSGPPNVRFSADGEAAPPAVVA